MTKAEFKKQYDRMREIYGEKTREHAAEWYRQFAHINPDDLERFVSQVIREYRSFGSDKWPLPGDFTHITGTIPGDPPGRPGKEYAYDEHYKAWIRGE